ncbi:MAG: DUF309 domain-containing protein [Bacteriovoracaceae bacterium]
MSLTKRELLPYAHRPGVTPHPQKEGGYWFGVPEPEVEALSFENYSEHIDYLYGFDLFNAGYFWESHVYWEAIWHENGRKGEIADFLKALIIFSAGCLKLEVNQVPPARTHFERAEELISNILKLRKSEDCSYFGFELEKLLCLVLKAKDWTQLPEFELSPVLSAA